MCQISEANMSDPDDIEVIVEANDDATQITVKFKSPRSMTTVDLCGELEFLAHEMNRADEQLNKPGVQKH